MSLFRRKSSSAKDGTYTFLTQSQGEEMRRLCSEVFAQSGRQATVADDHISGGDGYQYGLETVARILRDVPESEWKSVLNQYFDTRFRGHDLPSLRDLSVEELASRTRAKIIDPATVTPEQAEESFNYVRWIARLPLLMAYDGPETISYLTDSDFERIGDLAWDVARQNLLLEGTGQPQHITSDDGGSMYGIMSESNFQSTWAVYPADLVEALNLDVGEHGMLISAPAATALNFHILGESSTSEDLQFMARMAATQYDRLTHPLSQHVYWWHGTDMEPLTVIEDNTMAFSIPESLAWVLK